MSTLAAELTELVARAASAAGYPSDVVALEPCVATNDPRHGDYQSNHAFRLGKALKTNPRAVAQAFAEHLPAHPMVRACEVAGPGFLNFTLDDAWLAADVIARATDPRLGTPSPGTGHTLVIDYSSPNIAKRMHVGHMRSTLIGNALDRLHRFLGWTVVADNHLGDWGTPFGKLLVGWKGWRDDAAYAADPVGELQRIYVEFSERARLDPTLDERAREETALLQAREPERFALWQQFVAASMAEFEQVYARLGVRFDVVLGESFYRDDLDDLVQELRDEGIAVEDKGAVVVRFDEPDLADHAMLIRKSDGAAMYATTDLATVRHRIRTWSPSLIAYVTDTRQQLHFRQVFAAARRMGVDTEFRHVWFGMLRFADGSVAATRGGTTLNLVDVLDTAVAYARKVVDEKSAELPEAQRAAIAESVGIGAVKYTDLSQNPQTDIVFEWDKMLSMEGNTAPYLMYAHARVHSIFRRGQIDAFTPGDVVLSEPVERELALAIARTSEAILAAAATWRPNLLADHLFSLANTFARFFHDCRVLDAEPAARQSRLSLCLATANALRIGLDLLGIDAPERL